MLKCRSETSIGYRAKHDSVRKLSSSVADSDPHVFGPPGSGSESTSQRYLWIRLRILLSLSKNSKKNLDFYCFVTSVWLFIFEKWCKSRVPLKSNMQKNVFLISFCWHLEGQWWKQKSGSISQKHGSADPDSDPCQNVMDPQHCFPWWPSGGGGVGGGLF